MLGADSLHHASPNSGVTAGEDTVEDGEEDDCPAVVAEESPERDDGDDSALGMVGEGRSCGVVSLEDAEGESEALVVVSTPNVRSLVSQPDLPKPNLPTRSSQQETAKHTIRDQLGAHQKCSHLVAELQTVLEGLVEAIESRVLAAERRTLRVTTDRFD